MTALEARALRYLQSRGPACAGDLGGHLWPERRARRTAVQGGGDYAAQMFLGRLRKKGWVRVLDGPGSSVWACALLGDRELEKNPA